jgi:hypothetical protein
VFCRVAFKSPPLADETRSIPKKIWDAKGWVLYLHLVLKWWFSHVQHWANEITNGSRIVLSLGCCDQLIKISFTCCVYYPVGFGLPFYTQAKLSIKNPLSLQIRYKKWKT